MHKLTQPVLFVPLFTSVALSRGINHYVDVFFYVDGL